MPSPTRSPKPRSPPRFIPPRATTIFWSSSTSITIPTSVISSTRGCRSSPASRTPTPSSPSRRSARVRSGLLFRPRRSLDRRQRFEICRDCGAILGRQLRGVLDDARHRAAGAIVIGGRAGFEEIGDVLLAPFGKPFLRDVRHPALAFRIWPAGEALPGDNAAEEISGTVALGAMAEAVDQIGAAIPAA